MPLDLVKTLSELVALPSVNPMGRVVSGPEYLEHRVTAYLESVFRKLDVPYERQTIEPGRDNIIARLDGDLSGPRGSSILLFDAHQDTVPVTGMTIEPWTPTVREGRLYGRGACDIKGGMAAMLVAFARLVEERPPNRPTVILSATVNEEHGFTGAYALCQLWKKPGSLFTQKPVAAVISEPTGLDVVVSHKGVVRWQLHTSGQAAHSSQPDHGVNAIYRMAPVLAALERYARDIVPTLGQQPLTGKPTLSVGTIQGGLSVNTVPDGAMIEIDRRVLPGEDPQAAYQHVIRYLREQLGEASWLTHDPPLMCNSGLCDRDNGPLAEALSIVSARLSGRGRKIGVPYGTNASATSGAGVPSVVFGPGSIEQAHTIDEWIALDQLSLASEIYYQFAASGFTL